MIYCMYEDEKGTHHAVRLIEPKFHYRDESKVKLRARVQKRIKNWIERAAKG
jgi:late competence protein required for DNA uptake (superfamily II DNA/RNA helicase)